MIGLNRFTPGCCCGSGGCNLIGNRDPFAVDAAIDWGPFAGSVRLVDTACDASGQTAAGDRELSPANPLGSPSTQYTFPVFVSASGSIDTQIFSPGSSAPNPWDQDVVRQIHTPASYDGDVWDTSDSAAVPKAQIDLEASLARDPSTDELHLVAAAQLRYWAIRLDADHTIRDSGTLGGHVGDDDVAPGGYVHPGVFIPPLYAASPCRGFTVSEAMSGRRMTFDPAPRQLHVLVGGSPVDVAYHWTRPLGITHLARLSDLAPVELLGHQSTLPIDPSLPDYRRFDAVAGVVTPTVVNDAGPLVCGAPEPTPNGLGTRVNYPAAFRHYVAVTTDIDPTFSEWSPASLRLVIAPATLTP